MSEYTEISAEAVGMDLAKIRELAALSQQKLAEKLEVDASRISRIEGGKIPLSSVELDKHLKAIGSERATSYRKYCLLDWKGRAQPSFWHPEWEELYDTGEVLLQLNKLKSSLPAGSPLIPQLEMYEQTLLLSVDFLSSVQHDVVFIGNTAVGKSCALCFLTDLVLDSSVGKRLDDRMVLEGGPGWTTLCEVRIQKGPKDGYGLLIYPQPEKEIRSQIRELCSSLSEREIAEADNGNQGGSEETTRALRNLMDLNICEGEDSEGNPIDVDPILNLRGQFSTLEELEAELFNRLRLNDRTETHLWHDEAPGMPPKEWLKQVFRDVNNGLRPDVSMPGRIDVLIPDRPFGDSPYAIRLIDTKGIDKTAIRRDIQDRLGDPRTLVVLCTHFGEFATSAQGLIEHARQTGATNALVHRTVLLVLAKNDEASGMKLPSGKRVETDEQGYERNVLRLKPMLKNIHADTVQVLHLNATREADVENVTRQLEQRIRDIRKAHVEQIHSVDAIVRDLREHHTKQSSQDAHDRVRKQLAVLLSRLMSLPRFENPVYMKLLTAMKNILHPQTVRASIVRNGDWQNLNIYLYLGNGTAADVQTRSTKFFQQLQGQIEQMLADEGLAPAHGFLNQLEANAGRWREKFVETCRRKGEELLRMSLYDDHALWQYCAAISGKGYRDEVANVLQEKGFQDPKRLELLEILELYVQKQWEKEVIEQLRKLSKG